MAGFRLATDGTSVGVHGAGGNVYTLPAGTSGTTDWVAINTTGASIYLPFTISNAQAEIELNIETNNSESGVIKKVVENGRLDIPKNGLVFFDINRIDDGQTAADTTVTFNAPEVKHTTAAVHDGDHVWVLDSTDLNDDL